MAAKVYTTTAPVPPGDVCHAVGIAGHRVGMFRTYVLANTKAEAMDAIYDAYSGSSVSSKDLTVTRANDDHVDALRKAGFLTTEGDVITTDLQHARGVSLVRMAPEADGDPQRVGEWGSEKDADGISVEFLQPVGGDKIMLPDDPILRRVLLEQRAEEERGTALHKAAERATERVAEFLDVRSRMSGNDSKVIYTVGADGRRAELTTTDLIDLIEFFREKDQ